MSLQKPETIADSANPDMNTLPLSPSNEDYYPNVAVGALMKILKDPSLSIHHSAVVQAVMYIFKTLGLKCVPFLPQVRVVLPTSNFLYLPFLIWNPDHASVSQYDEIVPCRNS